MIDVQKLMNVISNSSRETRKQYHLTLGQLIERLKECDPDFHVMVDVGGALHDLAEAHSYRGYYADLAFAREVSGEPFTVRAMLEYLTKFVLDKEFEGYKGGDFRMASDTPLWFSEWGDDSGIAMIDTEVHRSHGRITIKTKQVED